MYRTFVNHKKLKRSTSMCATAAMLPTTMFRNIFQWEFLLMPSIKYNFCNFDDTYKITNIIYNFFTIAKIFH